MIKIFDSILNFFNAETTVYSHRNRSIEEVASERGIDIDSIADESRIILESKGRVEAISTLRKRFHVPLATAWRFVDDLDQTDRN